MNCQQLKWIPQCGISRRVPGLVERSKVSRIIDDVDGADVGLFSLAICLPTTPNIHSIHLRV